MANLDKETVRKLSELSKIYCTDEECEKILIDLKTILDYIENLQSIDTEGVEPCNHVLEMVNVMREDKISNLLEREDFLANAPMHIGGMIKVPPVLKS